MGRPPVTPRDLPPRAGAIAVAVASLAVIVWLVTGQDADAGRLLVDVLLLGVVAGALWALLTLARDVRRPRLHRPRRERPVPSRPTPVARIKHIPDTADLLIAQWLATPSPDERPPS